MNKFSRYILSTLIVGSSSCEQPELDDQDPVEPDPPETILPLRPNIILIVADDMGVDDMSYRGNSAVHTPRLDSLAQNSMRFSNFFVHSVSAPTRASLLTGRHFLRTGVSGLHAGRDFVNLDETTIAEVLKSSGYRTGIWGKWHSGTSNGYYPWHRGFDEAYVASLYHHYNNTGLFNGESMHLEGWCDHRITDLALDFIDSNSSRPFFAMLSFLSVHSDWAAPKEYIEGYRNEGQSENFATLNGMLTHMDYQVGRVLDKVKELGIGSNTMIVFMSDNGANTSTTGYTLSDGEWQERNSSGYTGSKSKNYDGGIRSPLIIHWQGVTVSTDNSSLLSVMDLFPTLCEVAEAQTLSLPKPLDGVSFADLLRAPSTIDNSRSIYISHWAPFFEDGTFEDGVEFDEVPLTDELRSQIDPELQHIGIRKGRYKLLLNEYGADALSFWDLVSERKEEKAYNIYNSQLALAQQYKDELMLWYNSILSDQGAYTSSIFVIGGSETTNYYEILCYAPASISAGLVNSAHDLDGFNESGERATYRISVNEQGEYKLRIKCRQANDDMRFRVSTNLSADCGEVTITKDKYNSTLLTPSLHLSSQTTELTIELLDDLEADNALTRITLEL